MSLTAQERKDNKTWVSGQGYSMEIIDNPTAKVKWYRADGTPLRNLLPADPYHIQRFRRKGWRLTKYSDEQVKEFKDANIEMISGEPQATRKEVVGTPEAPLYVRDQERIEA